MRCKETRSSLDEETALTRWCFDKRTDKLALKESPRKGISPPESPYGIKQMDIVVLLLNYCTILNDDKKHSICSFSNG